MVKLAIIEDSKALRENYIDYFSIKGKFQIIWSTDNINEVLSANLVVPKVILLDVNILGVNAVDSFQLLKQKYPNSYIIILTAFDNTDYVKTLVKKGVNGYLLKSISLAEIHRGIELLIDQGFTITPQASNQLLVSKEYIGNSLTKREVQIAKLISEGCSYNEASKKLLITNYTINQHLKNIYRKLGVSSKRELILKVINSDGK